MQQASPIHQGITWIHYLQTLSTSIPIRDICRHRGDDDRMTDSHQYDNMFLNTPTHSTTMTERCQISGCKKCHAPYIVGIAIGRAQMGDKGESDTQ